jgi:hypothetical protein
MPVVPSGTFYMTTRLYVSSGLPVLACKTIVPTVQEVPNSHLYGPDEEVSSNNSIDDYHHCFIRPEPSASNAESAQREEEINENIRLRKLKRKQTKEALPDTPRSSPTQRQEAREEVDLSLSVNPDEILLQHQDNNVMVIQQNVQTITLDDLNPHGLYPHHDNPLPAQLITVIYDSGASITMLPGAFADSWRNLRPSLMQFSGAFATENQLQHNLSVGEFHAKLTLDDGEKIRAIFPEAVSLPPNTTHIY